MTEDCYDVVVLGVERAERQLTKAGITDFAVLESCDPDGAVFDEATHLDAAHLPRADRHLRPNPLRP